MILSQDQYLLRVHQKEMQKSMLSQMPLKYITLVERKRSHMRQRERGGGVKGTRPEPLKALWFTAPRDSTSGGKIWVKGLLNRGRTQSSPQRGVMVRGCQAPCRAQSKLQDLGHKILSPHLASSTHSPIEPTDTKIQDSPNQGLNDPKAEVVAQLALKGEVVWDPQR